MFAYGCGGSGCGCDELDCAPIMRVFAAFAVVPSYGASVAVFELTNDIRSKLEVINEIEPAVQELIDQHESSRNLWHPSELLDWGDQDETAKQISELRGAARGIPDAVRVAVALNLITEEGLPHFHRLIAVYFGDESYLRKWNNLWTAEEDRHGVVIHDYCRASGILHGPSLDRLQFDYLRAGFHPSWERDPYRLFAYTTMQERATQFSHVRTGKVVSSYEPVIANILYRVAGDEARHFGFYRRVFAELLDRDPNRAMVSASKIMPGIEMPGLSMPNFGLFSDVVRRAGVYGPREYIRIVEEQIDFWRIATRTGLDSAAAEAQEKILAIPKRLERVAEITEQRSKPKTYSFDLVWQRSFSME